MLNSLISFETKTSEPVQIGNTHLRLTSQALRISLPFLKNGGLIWNRPVSVTAQAGSEMEQVLPVVDITRIVQLAVFAGSIMVGIFAMRMARRRV
jgi:hypothetical protein